jgi:hypothetical protein
MASSLVQKLVSSASVAGQLGAGPDPIKQLVAALHVLFLSLLIQDLSIGLRMLLDLSPIDLSVRYFVPALERTQAFPCDLR